MKPFTEIKKIFDSDDWGSSKKREAMQKAFDKLKSKGKKLRNALRDNNSKKKNEELRNKLKTNQRHRRKARKLLKEIGA